MGGARCSYRNCNQRSDQVTHMFHFPVFDKVRCHQWITNAQKQNYLNLKVSQLKNRVICQHHFTDNSFMNSLKKKLKYTAVPTENGPYCAASTIQSDNEHQSNAESELPINIDDIENEFTFEKRAHFSVKYGDFLTNDVSEGITLCPSYKSTSIKLKDTGLTFNRFDKSLHHSRNKNRSPRVVRMVVNKAKARKVAVKKLAKTESSIYKSKLPNPKVVSIQFEELNLNPTEQNKTIKPDESPNESPIQPNTSSSLSTMPSTKKVKIISEKSISEPLMIKKGELQPVSPSIIINMPNKKRKANIEINGQEVPTLYLDHSNNMAPSKTEQQFDNSSGISSQFVDPNRMNEYIQPTTLVDQIASLDNSQVMTEITGTDITDVKPMDYLTSEANQDCQFLKEETDKFMNMDHNISEVPNVEFVSSSLAGPSVFTLVNVPPVTGTVTDCNYMQTLSEPQVEFETALLQNESGILAPRIEPVSPVRPLYDTLEVSKTDQSDVNKKPLTSKSNTPLKSLVKNKMPPEKLAAIEEKRKYNMKLRDIINSCLNNMEDESDLGKLTVAMKKESSGKKVGEHLAKQSNQPESQQDSIAYFETRLQRLEDTLLNKIEQNSQKIIDLKKAIKPKTSKKSTSTQTYQTAEANKRSLYHQMSQYLTPEVNSLIYEELFLNNCLSKDDSLRKRKKR